VPPRILIAEDDANVAYVVVTALKLAGFETVGVANGNDALRLAESDDPLDLIILDVMMPGIDGFELLGRLRNSGVKVPVFFLTARDGLLDRIKGLKLGADDYLTKPFNVEELVARVRAILRRTGELPRSQTLTCDDLVLDDDAYRVVRGDEEITLSPTEYRMLRFLIRNSGHVMTKTQIRDHVWDYGFNGEATVVETFISSLRKKIDTKSPKLIHTVRGVGYRLDRH
jgi:two-component system, OmpR family, response regulator